MLQLILGRAATGKTEMIYQMLKQHLATDGSQAVLLVPEQFSFESERALLRLLGQSASTNVPVLSFTRLVEEVGRIAGGIATKTLTDCDRIILMGKALEALSGELPLWNRYVTSGAFARAMVGTIRELKLNAITPADLRRVALTLEGGSLRVKLTSIAQIMDYFDALLADRFVDPDDDLTRLYDRLNQYPFFEGKTVFLDAFKGFTGQQYRILDRVFSQAEHVVLTLPGDDAPDDGIGLFSNVKATRRRLESLAKRHGVKIADAIVLREPHYSSPALVKLEAGLAGIEAINNSKLEVASDRVSICEAETIFDEVNYAAETIRRLVRESGYRYRDFVIIARNAERYADLVEDACARQDVPCFMDKRLPVEHLPLLVFTDAALEAAGSFGSDAILRYLKTGLAGLSFDETSVLENYIYIWRIKGSLWQAEWTMDPDGFQSSGPERAEKIADRLSELNALRRRVIEPLEALHHALGGTPRQVATAIFSLLKKTGADAALAALSGHLEQAEKLPEADLQRRSWDVLMELLDRLVLSLDNRPLPARRFFDAWRLALSFVTLGNVPQMLDEVTFGAADRIRPSRPKVAIVIGANQGIFPQPVGTAGLLARDERSKLVALGIEIPDHRMQTAIDENLLVYTSLCCPSERLILTYCMKDGAGNSTQSSGFVGIVRKILPDAPFLTLTTDNTLPETPSSAFTRLAAGWNRADALTNALKQIFVNELNDQRIPNLLQTTSTQGKMTLDSEIARQLFGETLQISATKFDTFHRCRFSYFCRYGLRAGALQPADLDVLQRGTLVHAVLEAVIHDYGKGLYNLTSAQITGAVKNAMQNYLEGIPGISQIETPRFRFLLRKMESILCAVIGHMAEEFGRTAFEPKHCEWKIGEGGDAPAIEIPLEWGSMQLQGSIDRVDTFKNYVRVVDYKTGSKSFKLPDTLYGLNLQMLLYLYAIVRGPSEEFAGARPAGVLYMPSKQNFSSEHEFQMNGILLSEPEAVVAMDPENSGEFIPRFQQNRDGSVRKGSSYIAAEEFELIFDYIEVLLKRMGNTLRAGDIAIDPIDGRESTACQYCDFAGACGHEGEKARRVPKLSNEAVFSAMKGECTDGVQSDKGSKSRN